MGAGCCRRVGGSIPISIAERVELVVEFETVVAMMVRSRVNDRRGAPHSLGVGRRLGLVWRKVRLLDQVCEREM